MNFLQSLLLGVLQGATEFLPVSSSGHLLVLRQLLALPEIPILYDVLLHVSTLAVVILIFRRKIGALFISLYRWIRRNPAVEAGPDRENLRLIIYILLATMVTAVLGLLLSPVDAFIQGKPRFVALFFVITAGVLIVSAFAKGRRDYLTLPAVLLIGLAQGFAVLPGLSRSGITISVALLCGLNRERAGEFSFLLAIPAIFGALVLTLRQAGDLLQQVQIPVLAVGMIGSFAVGFLALLLLLRLLRRGRLYYFSIYLIPLSIIVLL